MSASAQAHTPLSIYTMLIDAFLMVCVCVLEESMECVVSAGLSGLGLTTVALSCGPCLFYLIEMGIIIC